MQRANRTCDISHARRSVNPGICRLESHFGSSPSVPPCWEGMFGGGSDADATGRLEKDILLRPKKGSSSGGVIAVPFSGATTGL